MQNEIKTFTNDMFGEIRTMTMPDGQIGFVGKDVAEALGYKLPRKAVLDHVDEDDVLKWNLTDSLGRNQLTTFISESGLYALILSSKLPTAKAFKHWVTSEVLPQIRQTGGYISLSPNPSPSGEGSLSDTEILSRALMIAQKTIELKSSLIEQQKPKVEYCDDCLKSEDCVTTSQIAKEFGMSAIRLNNILHELGIQFKQSGQWFLYAKFAKMGFAKERTAPYFDSKGKCRTAITMVWTEPGKRFVSELIRNDYDVKKALEKLKD